MTRFLGATIVGMLALFSPLSEADEPADQFVRIYELIQQADALTDSGHTDLARQKYLEAQSELVSLRKAHPGWNDSVVDFRLQYVGGKLGSPAATNSPPAAPVDKAGSPVAKTGAEERV